MKKTSWAILMAVAAPSMMMGAEPTAGVVVWPGSELKAYSQKLAPKVDAKKVAVERIGTFGNHLIMVAHREADGEAELHEVQADFFVVQSGEATLITGGKMVDGKTTAPGEVRAPSIAGGERRTIAPGDMVHIPAKIPHQLMIPAGKEFTYVVIKVDTP